MSDFYQDMQNLLNAYDSNWEDYLILREQFIEKYSLSVDKLEDHLLPYSKEMVQKIRDEKMQLVTADEFLKLHKESLTAIRDNDKLKEENIRLRNEVARLANQSQVDYENEYNKIKERCDSYEKTLREIYEGIWFSADRRFVVDTSDKDKLDLFELIEQALKTSGEEGSGDE